MTWFRRNKAGIQTDRSRQNEVPDGYWLKCPSCSKIQNRRVLDENRDVCDNCGHHFPMKSDRYLELLFDGQPYETFDAHLEAVDPLEFRDRKTYRDRLERAWKDGELRDAVRSAVGPVGRHRLSVAVMDFSFIGGSMGSVVGEVIARAIVRAYEQRIPLLIVTQSGGARMMEGALSLMQMAKTSAHLARFAETGLPYLTLLTHPTTGGVTASFAMLGDIQMAEPGALIGFAGPRVIRETIGQDLPEGFQRAEFLQKKGFVDLIVDRRRLRGTLEQILDLILEAHVPQPAPAEARSESAQPGDQ